MRNAKLVHGYGNNDLRRVKTDRKDAVKLANYGIEEDYAADQISVKEYVDPFTGDKNKKA